MDIRIVEDVLLCRGRRVKLLKRILEAGDKTIETDLVSFGESVVILPLLKDGRILMLRQYRSAINRWILELPAGRIDDGENMYEAAKRELLEETGYRAGELTFIGSFYVSPGYSDEFMHLFLAKDLEYIGMEPQEDEIIETIAIQPDKIPDMLYRDVIDGKSIVGLLTYIHLIKR